MQLLVALGNPGARYALNRHNVGWLWLDSLISSFGTTASKKQKFQSECFDMEVAGEKLLAIKPQTFMNRSGEAVQAAMQFYKIMPEQVHVMHDDIDLAFLKIKTKQGGGHAGHNGLRSIDDHIGSNYHRVRIGVGRPAGADDVRDFVLHDFTREEQTALNELLPKMTDLFPEYLAHGGNDFTSKLYQP
jgi:peptidyl-tRNA hydrolase, PTH1 family